jgi:hypothetical protein
MNGKKDMEKFEVGGERRFKIPKVFLEEFMKEPHVLMKNSPIGLWPIDLDLIKDSKFFSKLFADKEFASKYEVVIMPK